MNKVALIQEIMFNWEVYSMNEIKAMAEGLPLKLLRYLGCEHPDNRMRKIFFRLSNVSVGGGAVINRGLMISDNYEPLVVIGDRCALATNITIIADSNPNNSLLKDLKSVKNCIFSKPVILESDVWVGANAIILGGVRIAEGSIIGAGALVNKDTEPYSVYAGVPIRKLRGLKD
ncbi:acyltransferase [Helicobacter apodemus]|uniref:Galactoside O-acetyltransferase n=1 Tax=Helicobacter apodemus TaxID=135569 RepID=A0A2U8FBB1_9HELI|nr:acyltransferase [Helicobacter apodemus]AWI33521.1 galactoside O-acetyltransferase [Helicobacter apodemus]